MIKKRIDPMKIPAVTLKSTPVAEYPAGKRWIIASPNKAPKAKLNKNLMVISKQASDAIFLQNTITIAVANPKALTPNPARNPNPHR